MSKSKTKRRTTAYTKLLQKLILFNQDKIMWNDNTLRRLVNDYEILF
jgi:hypothetical protein